MEGLMRARRASALVRLDLVLQRPRAVMSIGFGLAVPLGICWVLLQRHPEGVLRIVLGGAFLSAAIVLFRQPAYTLVSEKVFKHRQLLAAVPVPAADQLFAHAVHNLLGLIYPSLFLGIAVVLFRVAWPADGAWIAPALLGAACLYGAALVLAALADDFVSATIWINAVLAVATTGLPVYYSLSQVPDWLQPALRFTPPALSLELADTAWRGEGVQHLDLLILAVWAVVLLTAGHLLALRGFQSNAK